MIKINLKKLEDFSKSILKVFFSPRTTHFIGEIIFTILGMRNKKKKLNISESKRILIIKLDEIGDMALLTPFLRELRRFFPDSHISLLVKPETFNLIELCPQVDKIFTYNGLKKKRLYKFYRYWAAVKLAYKYLWPLKLDLAIVPRWGEDYYSAGFIAYLSGARERIGYSSKVNPRKSKMNSEIDTLYTHVINDVIIKHEVEYNLNLIKFLGGDIAENRLEIFISKDDDIYVDNLFSINDINHSDLIISIGPSGGNSIYKQWREDNFIELGIWLQKAYNARLFLVGGEGDKILAERIAAQLDKSVINMAGKTTLRQTAALFKKCRLFIGNDTGPMHIAAAMDIPVAALFFSSCYHRFRPWGEKAFVIKPSITCHPCLKSDHPDRCGICVFDKPKCVQYISVQEVKNVVEKMLQEKNSPPFSSDFR